MKLIPILLIVLYAVAMWLLSAWRLRQQLTANSTPLNDPRLSAALDRLGFPAERPAQRLSHWSPYLRAGLFDLWRCVLCTPAALPLPLLAAAGPARPARRWSRLMAPHRGVPSSPAFSSGISA